MSEVLEFYERDRDWCIAQLQWSAWLGMRTGKYGDPVRWHPGPREFIGDRYHMYVQSGYVWNRNGMLKVLEPENARVDIPPATFCDLLNQGIIGRAHDLRHDSSEVFNETEYFVIFDPSRMPEWLQAREYDNDGSDLTPGGRYLSPVPIRSFFKPVENPISRPLTWPEVEKALIETEHIFGNAGAGIGWNDVGKVAKFQNTSSPDPITGRSTRGVTWDNPFYGSDWDAEYLKITTPWYSESWVIDPETGEKVITHICGEKQDPPFVPPEDAEWDLMTPDGKKYQLVEIP